jgi:ubiquinone/menaquinone biosynthesis C-methylase UbiE
MKTLKNIGLENVQAVYGGPEGDLWELVMGEQIHIGGFQSSMDLAKRAGIGAGMQGIDLCCCSGAGMRFLVKFCGVASMRGVDATAKVVERGRQRCHALGLDKQIAFTLADVCASGLPSASADFVWGEDAWCYVVDKPRLIAEAARIVKPGEIGRAHV